MTVALSTTKRKFHKILDSISNASNTSLVPQGDTNNASTIAPTTTLESPAKKVRIARPVSAVVTSTPRMSTPHVRASSSTLKPSAVPGMPTVVHKSEPPNFAPWDRAQFLKRLESFRHVDKWMSKPDKINEVQWAKRGWSCVGRDTVRCIGGCSHEIVIKLESDVPEKLQNDSGAESDGQDDEDDWREKAQEDLIERYIEMIVAGHSPGCLWRQRGCDDIIFRLPLYHQANSMAILRQRYDSLVAMAADLPTNIMTPPAFLLSAFEPEISSLLQHPQSPSNLMTIDTTNPTSSHPPSPTRSPPTPPLNREAFVLAMFGWQAEKDHINGLATCNSCFRRLGLWLFRTRISPTGEEKEAAMARLDVVGEHRDYCPWIDASSQNGPAVSRPSTGTAPAETTQHDKHKAGWELLTRLVLNVVRLKRREAREEKPNTQNLALDDEVSVSSTFGTGTTAVEGDSKNETEKDKERWARLKRIKQAFSIKKKKKGNPVAA